jgi:hypothetical protein
MTPEKCTNAIVAACPPNNSGGSPSGGEPEAALARRTEAIITAYEVALGESPHDHRLHLRWLWIAGYCGWTAKAQVGDHHGVRATRPATSGPKQQRGKRFAIY